MSQHEGAWATTPSVDTAQPESHNPENNANQTSLIEFLCGSLSILWKEWPKQMQCKVLDKSNQKFSLSGECPHCLRSSVFMIVAGTHTDHLGTTQRYHNQHYAAMRCQGCLGYILGIVGSSPNGYEYIEHYPVGAPDDSVAAEVAAANPTIALDFAESLRCLWVGSYKAAVAMCRRSVEATCKHFGATGGNLEKKIDSLAAQGRITEPLKEMAHAVRLSGNRGLHGKRQSDPARESQVNEQEAPLDDLDLFGEDEAKAMIAFTKELFHHVFVMPALLDKYKSKPKVEAEQN